MWKKTYRLFRYDWPLHFVLVFTNWFPDNVKLMRIRGWLASSFIGSCGKSLCLGRNIVFYNPVNVHIGDDVYIAYNCWIGAGTTIRIGNKVSIGPGCILASGRHILSDGNFADKASFEGEKIEIGDGSWLGGNVNVAGGTKLGKSTLVAAGCSVKGAFEDKVLLATSRATIKKRL